MKTPIIIVEGGFSKGVAKVATGECEPIFGDRSLVREFEGNSHVCEDFPRTVDQLLVEVHPRVEEIVGEVS